MNLDQNENRSGEEIIIVPEPEVTSAKSEVTPADPVPNDGEVPAEHASESEEAREEPPVGPAPEEKPEPPLGKAIKAMVFGIISIEAGCLPVLSILGIVFAVLARRWSMPIIRDFPYTGARLFAKAGRITGTVGLILSIIFTAFWTLYIDLIVAVIIMAAMG